MDGIIRRMNFLIIKFLYNGISGCFTNLLPAKIPDIKTNASRKKEYEDFAIQKYIVLGSLLGIFSQAPQKGANE